MSSRKYGKKAIPALPPGTPPLVAPLFAASVPTEAQIAAAEAARCDFLESSFSCDSEELRKSWGVPYSFLPASQLPTEKRKQLLQTLEEQWATRKIVRIP